MSRRLVAVTLVAPLQLINCKGAVTCLPYKGGPLMVDKIYPHIDKKTTVKLRRIVYNVDQAPFEYVTSRLQKSTDGVRTPGFPLIKRENAFSSTVIKENWIPGFHRTYWFPDRQVVQNIVSASCPIRTASPAQISDARYRCIQDFYGWIPQTSANLALLYAERVKTGESIMLALGGILKAVRDVRNRRPPEIFMNASQLAGRKKFTGAWLNYIYGIKPFAQDLYKIANNDPLTQVWWGKGYAKLDLEWREPSFSSNGKLKVKCKYGLSLANPFVATLAQTGMTNPLLIGWELTPFSFMADWLLPVGPYLEQLSMTQGFTLHAGSMTVGYSYIGYAWDDEWTKTRAQHNVSYRSISRTTTAFPSAPIPRFKNPFSPIHGLNALSIIHQYVKDPSGRPNSGRR